MTTRTTEAAATTEPVYTQARIRVNQDGAELLWQLILAEETRITTARRQVALEDVPRLQETMKAVRRVKDEIERVLFDMGWGE